jgi:hypothetical protein
MKIAIISDTHDRLSNLSKFLKWAKENEPPIIIHCGDVATFKALENLVKNFSGKVYLSFGNADLDIDKMKNLQEIYSSLYIYEKIGEVEIGNLKIAFTHYPWTAKELAQKNSYHFIFYGHTHKPWAEKINKTYLINPGNLEGEPYQPTFCVLDLETKEFRLVLLNQT